MTAPSAIERPAVPLGVLWFALLFPTVLTWVYFVAMRDRPAAVQQSVFTIGKAIQFGTPAVAVWCLARRRVGPLRVPLRGLLLGLVFGLVVAALMWGGYRYVLEPAGYFAAPAEAIRAKFVGMGVAGVPSFVAVAIGYCFVHSLLEEYYWRWFVFGELARRGRGAGDASALPAVLISSIGFTGHHVVVLGAYFGWASPATYVFSFGIAIGGAFWAWLYRSSGSLYASWFSHVVVDAAIFLIAFDIVRPVLGP